MKLKLSSHHKAGLTLFEVLVVIGVVMIVGVVVLATHSGPNSKHMAQKITCVNNLKQIGLAYRIWEGDQSAVYPMGISVTNGGAMEMAQAGNTVMPFLVTSNELSTPKILYCPADEARVWATNFNGLTRSNVSYFVGVDVTNDVNPSMLLSGDCNFAMSGKPVSPGLLFVATNDPIAWGIFQHTKQGNLLLSDGSVQSTTTFGLQAQIKNTGLATNRWAIP